MNKKAICPGTFDPITLGHVDIIERASALFSTVIVAIASNAIKKPLFSLEERTAFCAKIFAHLPNVTVMRFEGLLLTFAQQQGATIIVRGLRNGIDFDYEWQLAGMNRLLDPSIESVFLTSAEKYQHIASSLVREVAFLGGDVSNFVPGLILEAFKKKYPARPN